MSTDIPTTNTTGANNGLPPGLVAELEDAVAAHDVANPPAVDASLADELDEPRAINIHVQMPEPAKPRRKGLLGGFWGKVAAVAAAAAIVAAGWGLMPNRPGAPIETPTQIERVDPGAPAGQQLPSIPADSIDGQDGPRQTLPGQTPGVSIDGRIQNLDRTQLQR